MSSKRIIGVALMLGLCGCGNQTGGNQAPAPAAATGSAAITAEALAKDPARYAGQEVKVTGIVSHVSGSKVNLGDGKPRKFIVTTLPGVKQGQTGTAQGRVVFDGVATKGPLVEPVRVEDAKLNE